MKKNISTIILVLFFLVGLSIFLYPTLSNIYNERVGSHLISKYDSDIKNVEEDKLKEILDNAKAYNFDLLKKPIVFVNGKANNENYLKQLNIDSSGIIGYVEIEKIDVKYPIYKGTSEPVLQKGIGHLEGSALPIGGIGNHAVLSGHTGLPSSKLLTNLDKLTNGDIIVINICGETLYYSVTETNVVLPKETELLKPKNDKDLLTLFTCTPYGVNSHRLLVTAHRTDIKPSGDIESVNGKVDKVERYPIIILPLIIFCIIILVIKKRKTGEV